MNTETDLPEVERLQQLERIIRLVLVGLFLDYCGYCGSNTLMWLGGPLGLATIMWFTVIMAVVVWFFPYKEPWNLKRGISTAIWIWPFATAVLFLVADEVQNLIWMADAERVALEYGKGALPPSCKVSKTYRANLHTPIECTDPIRKVVSWYRERLDTDWTESRERGSTVFTRYPGTEPPHIISISSYGVTNIVVSPTQTNKHIDKLAP